MKSQPAAFLRSFSVVLFLLPLLSAETAYGDINAELFKAAEAGSNAKVEQLLKQGADVDAKHAYGRTPLMIAAYKGHTETVKFLIAAGADLKAQSGLYRTAMMVAVLAGSIETVKVLIDAGADDDGIGDACDPFPNDADHDKAQCFLDLTQAETDLATCEALPVFTDSDGDGEADSTDACPTTPMSELVDQGGCSQEEFCELVDASTLEGRRECRASDWQNDEPMGGTDPGDCIVNRLTRTCMPQ